MTRTQPNSKPAARRLVSLERGAQYADVSPRTMRRYIASGLIIGYRVGPRMIRVDLDQVDAVLLRPIPTAGSLDD